MKVNLPYLLIGIGVGITIASVTAFLSISGTNPTGHATASFFIGGLVYDITSDTLIIDQANNNTGIEQVGLLTIKLSQGNAFFSKGEQLNPAEVANKVTKGMNICAFVHFSDGELRAGKVFLETTCDRFKTQDT